MQQRAFSVISFDYRNMLDQERNQRC